MREINEMRKMANFGELKNGGRHVRPDHCNHSDFLNFPNIPTSIPTHAAAVLRNVGTALLAFWRRLTVATSRPFPVADDGWTVRDPKDRG